MHFIPFLQRALTFTSLLFADEPCSLQIVGGGTSGLTVASRLASDGRYTVAVIEAGGFYETSGDGNKTQIPAYEALYNTVLPTIDWGQFTTPQPVS